MHQSMVEVKEAIVEVLMSFKVALEGTLLERTLTKILKGGKR